MKIVSVFTQDFDLSNYEDTDNFLTVNCAGYYHDISGTSHQYVRKAGRKDYLLMYCTGGSEYIEENGIFMKLSEGWACLYKPGEPQYLHYDQQNSHLYWIHFTGYGCEEIFRSCCIGGERLFFVGKDLEIENGLNRIVNEVMLKRIAYEAVSTSLTLQCLLLMGRMIKEMENIRKEANLDSIIRVITYINNNYSAKISLHDLSSIANMSKFSFIRLFHDFTGNTPVDYLIRLRICKAKELMQRTDSSIKSISLEVGYENSFYFSRIFKKIEGVSPHAYILEQNKSIMSCKNIQRE